MRKIKKDDEVIVLVGKDRGKRGKVTRMVDGGKKVLVEGINLYKKSIKPDPQKKTEGGIIDREVPIHASNVAVYNPVLKRGDRIGIKVLNGKKVRYFKSTDELVDIV
jgi:large subunit ribosomal protein L24